MKLFWRAKGALFHTLHQDFTKSSCNFSILKQVLSICTNFHNNWLKTWSNIRILYFYWMRNYTGNFSPESLSKITWQINCKNWHNFESKFDIHEMFFLKVIFSDNVSFKGSLSGLGQFWATESPLKMIKNAFYFTLKALFVLKIFKFLFLLFGHV